MDIFTGEYHRIDTTNSSHIAVPYWIHSIDDGKSIFYDILSDYWQIGSIQNLVLQNNLICSIMHVTMEQFESPLDCKEWCDIITNNTYQLSLDDGKCIESENNDNKMLIDTDESEKHNVFENKLKITFYSMLFELFCVISLWIYCKKKDKWMILMVDRDRDRDRDGLEIVSNVSDNEELYEQEDIDSPAMQFDPANVQQILDDDEANLIELHTDID